ncbi:MAG: glycosyltransferase family 2 protein [Parcubacteria group bacterium]|nr:glycosyltransferase family 2 protein [Parcubacteria group bacterium]
MDISVVILNYNTKDFLLPCIKGMVNTTRDLDYEIIVVDNASTDGSVAYVKEKILPRFPQVKLLQSPENRGFSAGNNLGISRSSGRYALIMNPDIVIWDNSLKHMVDYMDANPKVGIAGPRLLSPDGSLQHFVYRFPSPQVLLYRRTPLARFTFAQRAIRNYLMADWDHRDNRPVDWVQGSCMIVRRDAIRDVGLMDERYFLFLEDTDWCRRFWEAGFEVRYAADVEIIHYHGRASVSNHFYLALFNKMS